MTFESSRSKYPSTCTRVALLARLSFNEISISCSQHGAYRRNSAATPSIAITENRRRVRRTAVIRVLPRRKKTKKEVTKVFPISQSSLSNHQLFALARLFLIFPDEISRIILSDLLSRRGDQGVRRQQFPEAADISSDLGTQASHHGASTHIGTARVSHYERS